jgi:hypothetical protein
MNRVGRSVLAGLTICAGLFVAGCGNSALTVSFNQDGISGAIVVQSDSTAINALKASAASEGLGGLSGAKVTDGSNPVGTQLCTWNTSTSSHSYTVAIYATNSSSPITAAFKAEVCTASVKNSMKSSLP